MANNQKKRKITKIEKIGKSRKIAKLIFLSKIDFYNY